MLPAQIISSHFLSFHLVSYYTVSRCLVSYRCHISVSMFVSYRLSYSSSVQSLHLIISQVRIASHLIASSCIILYGIIFISDCIVSYGTVSYRIVLYKSGSLGGCWDLCLSFLILHPRLMIWCKPDVCIVCYAFKVLF